VTVTEDAPATASPEIGRDRRRKEDQRLITGRTRWTDNIQLTGMLHVAMVRSPFAHAKITNIDTSEAKTAPNVVAVLTGADLGESQGVNINAWPITPDQVAPTHVPSSSTSTTRSCRPRWTSRRPPRTRSSRTPSWAPTSRRCGSSTPARPAPAVTSRRPSRRPAPTASSSSGSSASSG
jgi:hypothetical protein